MAKKRRKVLVPEIPDMGMAGGSEADFGRYVTTALLVANQDGCDCRACRILRRLAGQMADGIIDEEEIDA